MHRIVVERSSDWVRLGFLYFFSLFFFSPSLLQISTPAQK